MEPWLLDLSSFLEIFNLYVIKTSYRASFVAEIRWQCERTSAKYFVTTSHNLEKIREVQKTYKSLQVSLRSYRIEYDAFI